MKKVVFETGKAAAASVADTIIALLQRKPNAVLGLATGATMEPVYEALIAAYREGQVSFAQAKTFNLDEYLGLPASHASSYRSTMNTLLFDHVDIDRAATQVPDGMAADREAAAQAYEHAIRAAGGIDLQLLGIGRNGHIGFNEPGTRADSLTSVVKLHPSTIEANRHFFADEAVPDKAITMGIGTILQAEKIVVLATGAAKTSAVANAFSGAFHADCPASALNSHGNVIWYLDKAAVAAPATA